MGAAPAVKAGRDWDAYAAVIASFIGLLALAVSGYTAYVQRQQLRAQVWPHLEIEYSSANVTISAINQGTGPARVTAMRVTVGGAVVKNWSEIMKAAGISDGHLVLSTLDGTVVPPGKVVTVVQPANDEQSRTELKALLPGEKHALSMTVCYCSVLDECWVADSTTAQADSNAGSPDSCPIRASERFVDHF